MKKCPFCAEEIQEDAIKCRFCDEFLTEEARRQVRQTSEAAVWPKKKVYLTTCPKCRKEKKVDVWRRSICRDCNVWLPSKTEESTIIEVEDIREGIPLCKPCLSYMEEWEQAHFGKSPAWLITIGILITLLLGWIPLVGWAIAIAGITMLIVGVVMACRKDAIWFCQRCKTIKQRYATE